MVDEVLLLPTGTNIGYRMRGRVSRLLASIEAFPDFDITGDVTSFLDEDIPAFFHFKRGDQPIVDALVKSTKVMARYPREVGFGSELKSKHLKFCRILIHSSSGALIHGFNTFGNIGITVGSEVLIFESFDELCCRICRAC